MKKSLITSLLLLAVTFGNSQTAEDLFMSKDVEVTWLGVDFSHVKLIGDFSHGGKLAVPGGYGSVQFGDGTTLSTVYIRDEYFPKWNKLIVTEDRKYDIRGMLRKGYISIDIGMLMKINANAATEDMEAYKTPFYTKENLEEFISEYNIEKKEGIGVFFIAECLNKTEVEAYFHFVAINMKSKEILVYKRLRGKPQGAGLRNYWAGSIFHIIEEIRDRHYKVWKKRFN